MIWNDDGDGRVLGPDLLVRKAGAKYSVREGRLYSTVRGQLRMPYRLSRNKGASERTLHTVATLVFENCAPFVGRLHNIAAGLVIREQCCLSVLSVGLMMGVLCVP